MTGYRLLRAAVHLFKGLWLCAMVFPRTSAERRGCGIQQWSAQLLAICQVRVEINNGIGQSLAPRAMIVANHISWLDILVINSMHPCRFVAKSDIRDWPLIGWMSEQVGTVFIARGSRRDLRRTFEGLVASIHAGDRVAFFPEGTTAAQGGLLPFHANLFEAAIDAKVPVQPYALRYLDVAGGHHPAVDFTGDTSFARSMLAVLRAPAITAELVLLPAIDSDGVHRRELASAAWKSVAQALGVQVSAAQASALADNPPEAPNGHQDTQQ